MSLHHQVRRNEQAHAERRARGGDVAQDKAMISKAIREHENQEHGGKHAKLALKRGGGIMGAKPAMRLDKRARGGKVGKGTVNVIVQTSNPAEKQMAMQQGMKMGAMMAAKPPMPGPGGPPPMAGPGGPMPTGGPMGGPPRPPGLKRGGAVKLTAGAGGASGRLQKNNDYGTGEKVKVKGYTRRKAGGRVKEGC